MPDPLSYIFQYIFMQSLLWCNAKVGLCRMVADKKLFFNLEVTVLRLLYLLSNDSSKIRAWPR